MVKAQLQYLYKRIIVGGINVPVYEYICQECNEKFALLQSLYPAENDTECPRCSSKNVKKVLSSFSCAQGTENAGSVPPPNFGGGGG